MKKTLSLIALLVMAMTAFAQTFTDKSTVKVGSASSDMEEAQIELTANEDGTYDVMFKGVTNVYSGYTDTYGDVGFSNLTATTEDGITTLTGSGLSATTFTGAGTGYIPAAAVIDNGNVSVKFNDTKAYATLNAKFKYYSSYAGTDFAITFGDDNFTTTPEPPVTGGTKLVEDGLAPNGTVIAATPFSINWDKQKLVAKLDMSTCSNEVNENTFSISTDQADLGEWNLATGSTLHLFYIKDGQTWEASGWQSWTKSFKVQYRTAGSSSTVTYTKQVDDDANVVVELKKEGLYIDDELVFPASEMSALYADTESSLFFGSLQGDARSYATYKSVEIVNLENGGGTDPDPDPDPEPTIYTDKAHTEYWGDFDYTDKVVKIYDLGENKYKVVYNGYNLGSATTFDLVYNNVEGTTDADGYTTYTFDGKAVTENVQVDAGVIASVSEGEEVDATLNGKSKDGKLYATFTMTTMGSTAKTVYGTDFTEVVPPTPEPDCEFTDVVKHGFAPAGESWKKEGVAIDWDKQYIKAEIDLSKCSIETGNVLSVGKDVAEWIADGFHFYYRPSTKKLEVDYTATNGGNVIRTSSIPVEDGVAVIEISKADGVKVNGTEYNVLNDGMTEAKKEAAYAEFFALTEVQVGGCQGNNMSDATYNYIHVLDLPAEEVKVVETKTYTDKLSAEAIPADGGQGTVREVEDFKIDFNTLSDGTRQVVFNDFPISGTGTETFTFACSSIDETANENGTKGFTFNDTECTIDGVKCSVFGKATENLDGTLYWHFIISQRDGDNELDLYSCTFGTLKPATAINGVDAEAISDAEAIYTVGGAKVSKLHKGINIVRKANGKTVKVVVK